ncbi:hypothetical protein [Erythrobacter sp.]|nr:hypothetical protein [Erythrobacter sp.]
MAQAIALARTTRAQIALRQEAILRTAIITATALALILAGQPLPF